ncbi:MAG TPA: TlpA disulfide reductase family protein [Blastocatellia bacterium]|nr:TlpA disulfide reductase family protein [Blastocatellia bacterium]
MRSNLFLIAVSAANLFGVLACGGRHVDSGARNVAGRQLQLGALHLLDGSSRPVVTAWHKGTLLAFWATWCPNCREEIPVLSRFQSREQEDGIEVVGVNSGESARRIRLFLQDNPMPYPIALDTTERLLNQFGIQSLPAIVLVDRDGIVRYRADRLPGDPSLLEARLAQRTY